MATSKKKKTAPVKKPAASKRPAKPKRPDILGLPAQGDLKKFLEQRIKTFISSKAARQAKVPYAAELVLEDAEEMLEAPQEDLAGFHAEDMPVTARHLDYLKLCVQELRATGVIKRVQEETTRQVASTVSTAMAAVVAARNALAERAAVNGLSKRLFDIRRATGSPRSLHHAVADVLVAVRSLAAKFDSPGRARALLDALQHANDHLGEVAGVRAQTVTERGEGNLRRSALVTLTYAAMSTLSGWGKVMAGDNPDRQRRWRLDKVFPNQTRLRPPAPQDVVAGATADAPMGA